MGRVILVVAALLVAALLPYQQQQIAELRGRLDAKEPRVYEPAQVASPTPSLLDYGKVYENRQESDMRRLLT